MKFIAKVNWVLILTWALLLFHPYVLAWAQDTDVVKSSSYYLWIDVVSLGGFAMLQLIILAKIKSLYGFTLVLLYTLALLQGMRIMLSIDTLLTLTGVLFFLLELLVIFYLIGVRGYLRSDKGRSAFGLPVESHQQ